MPFTLAHPAAVLMMPKNKFLHKPALIIGSMSPDFIYFLSGVPSSKIGHTAFGAISYDLPLCFVGYYIYQYFIHPFIWQYLPNFISPKLIQYKAPHLSFQNLMIFICSCFIGIGTHIGLDSLTHETSTLVKHSKWLNNVIEIHAFGLTDDWLNGLKIYKILQYAGTCFGLILIMLYVMVMANKHPAEHTVSWLEKSKYWAIVTMFFLIILFMWQNIQPINVHSLLSGNHVDLGKLSIRLVNVALLSLIGTGIYKYRTKIR